MIRFIISIIGFVLAAVVFIFYTKSAYDGVKVLQGEIAQYDKALERANELQSLKQSLLSRYNAFNPADIDKLHKLLPDHVDNVRLVLDFDNLASRHNLALQNVVIGRGNADVASPGKPSNAEVIGANTNKYDSLTLKFSTQGTYRDFVAFMDEAQLSLRIVDLVSLTLSRGGESQGSDDMYRFDITIRTYWLK